MFSFPDGFQSHSVSRCLFNSTELKDSRYIYSCIYNKVEFLRFDSNIGLYVGYTSFGMRQANNLNNNPVALSRRRAQKEAFCHHNSGVLYRNVLNRSGEFMKNCLQFRGQWPTVGGQWPTVGGQCSRCPQCPPKPLVSPSPPMPTPGAGPGANKYYL